MKKRISITQLKPGMFLLSIDRPWWRSPFFFHRRRIKNQRQVVRLKRAGIREVEIDPQRGIDVSPPKTGKSQPSRLTTQPQRPGSPDAVASPPTATAPAATQLLAEELRKTLSEVTAIAGDLLATMRGGTPPPAKVVTPIVHRLLESVSHDPEASTSLMKTRHSSSDAASSPVDACALSLAVGKMLGLETGQLLTLGLGALLHELPKFQQEPPATQIPTSTPAGDHESAHTLPREAASRLTDLSQHLETVREIMGELQKSGKGVDVRPESLETEVDRLSQIVSLIHTYLSFMNGSAHTSSLPSNQALQQFQQLELPPAFDPELVSQVVRILKGPHTDPSRECAPGSSSSAESNEQPPAPLPTAPIPESHPSMPRILVAEENVIAQKMIVRMLAALGYDADVVTPGPGVSDAVARGSYAALLFDCPMPDQDAPMLQALRARVDAAGQGTTLIAMTTNVLPEDKEHCLTAGMHDHLAKPFTQEELKSVLERRMRQRSPQPSTNDPMGEVNPSLKGIQLAEALENMGGDAELLRKIIGVFLEEYPQQLAQIHAAFQQQDAESLERLAHAFKGAAGNIGAVEVSKAALAVEQSASHTDQGRVRQAIDVLEGELQQVYPALESVRQHGLPSTVGSAPPKRPRTKKEFNPSWEILVVIPMTSLRMTMVDILRGLGLRKIRQAGDGERALELLQHKRANLVITDWNLPKKNGAELTRAIRDSADLQHVPILIVTGSTTRDEVQEALNAGVNGYLLRPFTVETLEEKLLQVCQ